MAHMRKRAPAVVPGTRKVVEGMHCRILAVARTGSRDWRDRWCRLMNRLGLSWDRTAIQDHQDGPAAQWETAYDVWGPEEALAELTDGTHKELVRWEFYTTGTYHKWSEGVAAPPRTGHPDWLKMRDWSNGSTGSTGLKEKKEHDRHK